MRTRRIGRRQLSVPTAGTSLDTQLAVGSNSLCLSRRGTSRMACWRPLHFGTRLEWGWAFRRSLSRACATTLADVQQQRGHGDAGSLRGHRALPHLYGLRSRRLQRGGALDDRPLSALRYSPQRPRAEERRNTPVAVSADASLSARVRRGRPGLGRGRTCRRLGMHAGGLAPHALVVTGQHHAPTSPGGRVHDPRPVALRDESGPRSAIASIRR